MADLKYYDGTQWVTLKGSGVALSTVGVDVTDCDLTPEGANGSFTPDGQETDGTQKYKLDLNLPRGTVVTESEAEPATAGACVGDLWIDPSDDDGVNGGDGTPPIQAGGRLTLDPNQPVMVQDTVSSTLYYVPYTGDTFSVYSPEVSLWVARKFSTLSLDVGSLSANKIYDIFLSYDSDSDSWVITPAAWADDKTRATELSRLDGIVVSGTDSTQRLIGTIRTNGSGQVEGKKINRCLWNAYNQVLLTVETRWFNVFAYSGATWIPYANSTTNGQARVSCVLGAATNISMISPCMAKYGYTGVVLGDLSESWNGGEYTGTPGHSGHPEGATTTTTVDSKVAPAGYNYVQGVISGINGTSLFRDLTIQGNYYG